jgi:uncharacterized protein YecT (DUF1311 family)
VNTRGLSGSLRALLIVVSFSAICAAWGECSNNCGNEPDTGAIVACHAKRYDKADKELNRVYGETLKSLSPEGQQKLKESQRAWLKYRDAAFALAIEANKETRSYGSVVVADYKASVVEKRVLELQYLFQSPADPPVKW